MRVGTFLRDVLAPLSGVEPELLVCTIRRAPERAECTCGASLAFL
jgi:hypothetical protein